MAAEGTADNAIKNASFEEPVINSQWAQPDAGTVPAWSTTAAGNKIELVSTRINGKVPHINNGTTVEVLPDGNQFAELNADEESTLYQDLDTLAGHVYEWGLAHRGRSGIDKMVLIIGPTQDIAPAKPSRSGRDQFMRMTEWAERNAAALGFTVPAEGCSKKVIVYSKPFASNGGFKGGSSEESPFSLASSDVYTEAWSLWIIADGRTAWGKYGTNSPVYNEAAGVNGGLDYQCSYTVPAGQAKTTFAFCAYSTAGNNKTIGNLIDDLDFRLYHTVTVSATSGGRGQVSAVINGIKKTEAVPEGSATSILVRNGQPMEAEAFEELDPVTGEAADAAFTGAYITREDDSGSREFISADRWTRSVSTDGRTATYSYSGTITTPVEMVMIFVRSPTVTYEANGGQKYVYEPGAVEPTDVVSFRPTDGGTVVRTEYTAHAAAGKDANWQFDGWLLARENRVLPADHTVFYDQDSKTFTVKDGDSVLFSSSNVKGLTLVAQWRWKQSAFTQLRNSDRSYTTDNTACGTVKVQSAGAGSSSAYFAKAGESVTVTATANPGYLFLGWFQKTGESGDQVKRVSTAESYTYTAAREGVQTLYARFVPTKTVTYQWTDDTAKRPAAPPTLPDPETAVCWEPHQLLQTAYVTGSTKIPARVSGAPGNWVFSGWKTNAGTYVRNNELPEVTGDVTLTGEWTFIPNRQYTVTIVSGDHERNWIPSGLSAPVSSDVYAGDSFTVPTAPVIPVATEKELALPNGTVLQGTWEFLGGKRSDTGETLQPGQTFIMPEHDVTLTGQWKFTPDTFKIQYHLNGGSGETPEPQNEYYHYEDVAGKNGFVTIPGIPLGSMAELRDFTGTAPAGWYFAGWSTGMTDSMGITMYQGGQTVSSNTFGITTNGAVLTLHAIYRPITQITVQFSSANPDGGTVSPRSGAFAATQNEAHYIVSGADATSTPTPSQGYHFTKWCRKNVDNSLSDVPYDSNTNALTVTKGMM